MAQTNAAMWPVWTALMLLTKYTAVLKQINSDLEKSAKERLCSVLTLSVICSISLRFLIARCTWASRGGRDGARSGYVQTPVVTAPLQTAWLPPWVSQVCQGLQLQQWAEDCALESRSGLFHFLVWVVVMLSFIGDSLFLLCISFINLACRL